LKRLGRGEKPEPTPSPGLARWFWGGFLGLLLLGLLLALFAAVREGRNWIETNLAQSELPPTWTAAIRVTLSGGEALDIEAAAVPQIQSALRRRLEERRAAAQTRLAEDLNTGLRSTFAQASAQIPTFLDWYYSLGGEYSRLFHAAWGDLGSFLEQRVEALIFGPAGTADAIDGLAGQLDSAAAKQLRSTALDLQQLLLNLVRESSTRQAGAEVRVTGQWDLGQPLSAVLGPYLMLRPLDLARQGVATSAGAAAAAVTAKKLGGFTVAKMAGKIGAKVSPATLAALASKLGLKSAAKAGGSLAGAGSGAAAGATLCASTALGVPVAPGCALLGGVATGLAVWLLVDSAVIEAEEYLHREELEASLLQALGEQEQALRAALGAQYAQLTNAAFDRILREVNRGMRPRPISPQKDFVPARAATEGQDSH